MLTLLTLAGPNDDLFLYFIWTTCLKFTVITFLRSPMKLRKIDNRCSCYHAVCISKMGHTPKTIRALDLIKSAMTNDQIRMRKKQKVPFYMN